MSSHFFDCNLVNPIESWYFKIITTWTTLWKDPQNGVDHLHLLSTHIYVLLIHWNKCLSKIFKLWGIFFFRNNLGATSTFTIRFRFNFTLQILMCWICTLFFIHNKMHILKLWVWANFCIWLNTKWPICLLNVFIIKSTFNHLNYMNSNIWPSWLNVFHSLINCDILYHQYILINI